MHETLPERWFEDKHHHVMMIAFLVLSVYHWISIYYLRKILKRLE